MLGAMQNFAFHGNSPVRGQAALGEQPWPWLVHLGYLAQAYERGQPGVRLSCAAGFARSGQLHPSRFPVEDVVSLKLFNGETRYRTAAEQAILRTFVRTIQHPDVLKELVAMHGKLPHMSRSNLDDACREGGLQP